MIKHKRALVIWAIIYPLVTVLLLLMDVMGLNIHLAVRTLVLTAIVVPMMVYVIVPMVAGLVRETGRD